MSDEKNKNNADLEAEIGFEQRRFYDVIVHEIRNQAGIISNLSEMLLDEKLAKSHEFYKQALQQTAERMTRLSQNFLDIEPFGDDGEVQRVNLADYLAVFCVPFEYLAKNKGLKFVLLIDENCPKYVNIDKISVGQILANLVGNAIKYTDQGEVKLHAYSDDKLIFEVIDTGIGLNANDAETSHRIFADYARLDAALDKQGAGLGLWISRKLARAMKGEVEVIANHPQNAEVGSCFRFSMPMPEVAEAEVETAVLEVPKNIRSGRILLVEDNDLNQRIIGTMLDSAKLEFDVASNIEQARKKAENQNYALILLDLNLPDGRGEDAVHYFNNAKIVALTAEAEKGLELRLKKSGFAGLVEKPIVIKDFFKVIYAILA